MKIAISKASGTSNHTRYAEWLSAALPSVEVVDLYGMSAADAVAQLDAVSGLILSGGEDVDPVIYGHPERRPQCGTINAERDAMELALAVAAVERSIPTLGICRGLQVLNVAFGGTLVADLPSQWPSNVEHQRIEGVDSVHAIEVQPGSMLKHVAGAMDGMVNSAHHQAIERIAAVFTATVLAPDGVIEAIEWGDAALGGKPFLLGVQWHPERMDYSNPFSLRIADHFLLEAAAYQLLLRAPSR